MKDLSDSVCGHCRSLQESLMCGGPGCSWFKMMGCLIQGGVPKKRWKDLNFGSVNGFNDQKINEENEGWR